MSCYANERAPCVAFTRAWRHVHRAAPQVADNAEALQHQAAEHAHVLQAAAEQHAHSLQTMAAAHDHGLQALAAELAECRGQSLLAARQRGEQLQAAHAEVQQLQARASNAERTLQEARAEGQRQQRCARRGTDFAGR
jgi:chromosome segregation ATPase